MKSNKKVFLIVGILVVVIIAYYFLSGSSTGSNKLDDFAKCLTSKDAVMFGAEWCGHCKDQKTMFGNSFKYVNYVECPQNQALCDQKGITGYPTWIINGTQYSGVQTFDGLKELTGCSV
jgi:thiol-disulfide isomerase/thioredoxin